MPRSCDACHFSSALVFCRADMAYLCMACDLKVHGANKVASRHERVWMCEVCEQAPAIVTCKADAASLCLSCDSDIHSANPLASRHQRVPVQVVDSALGLEQLDSHVVVSASNTFPLSGADGEQDSSKGCVAEAESWLGTEDGMDRNSLTSDEFRKISGSSRKTCDMGECFPNLDGKAVREKVEEESSLEFLSEIDGFLDLQFVQAIGFPQAMLDSIVPVHDRSMDVAGRMAIDHCNTLNGAGRLDAMASTRMGLRVESAAVSHSVSSSSMEFAVVPDSACSSASTRPGPGILLQVQSAKQLEPTATREARVLRYKERRRNRTFEKTIRYASRKAYAEARPRIKGRFAKRAEMCTVVPDTVFGVVPSL